LKAAYDPRISAVYLQIDNLNCGWAKADEIRRQILNFRKSGAITSLYFENFVLQYLSMLTIRSY